MTVPQVPSDDTVAEVLVRFLGSAARVDLGLDPGSRMVPAGQQMADALRCRLMLWCDTSDDRPELVAKVHALGTTIADLIDRAGMTRG